MTKYMLKAVVLFALFEAVVAQAQTYQPPPPFNHIVIIVQENRTPDNLFGGAPMNGALCGSEEPFEAGVDIQDGGLNLASQQNGGPYITCLASNSGLQTGGGYHGHQDPTDPNQGWVPQCDADSSGHCRMDGACLGKNMWKYGCPQYQYVAKPVVQPYFDIATNYGFANYMFETNQGPSFEAHQFLLGGTSSPVWPGDEYYQYFVAENPAFLYSGCPASTSPYWIDPGGNEVTNPPIKSECYDRNTLVTYQENNVVYDKTVNIKGGWKYYAQTRGIIWDAPEANPQICYGAISGSGKCGGPEFDNHVIIAGTTSNRSAPIFTDIQGCQLAAISWVTPDEAWSDHPGVDPNSLGPSWIADIVDAIGSSGVNSGGKCDYWKADPTVIFITWDDWGGFYDHVPPPKTYFGHQSGQQWVCGSGDAPNGWGCGYVYGFRVPLLVVSEYTPPNTVSGAITGTPTYPPPPQWTHDFGSILAFTENNFNLVPIAPQTPVQYTYADQNSLDAVYQGKPVVPLWDFFLGPGRVFTPISPTSPAYDASYFMKYYTTLQNGVYPVPTGPDGGDDD